MRIAPLFFLKTLSLHSPISASITMYCERIILSRGWFIAQDACRTYVHRGNCNSRDLWYTRLLRVGKIIESIIGCGFFLARFLLFIWCRGWSPRLNWFWYVAAINQAGNCSFYHFFLFGMLLNTPRPGMIDLFFVCFWNLRNLCVKWKKSGAVRRVKIYLSWP